jgi:hypothetical protein
MDDILDLDVFRPHEKRVKFTDLSCNEHTINLTVAFGVGLSILENREKFAKLKAAEDVDTETYMMILGLISEIGMQTDKALSVDFLKQNLSIEQGLMFIMAAMAPILEFVKKNMPGVLDQPETDG